MYGLCMGHIGSTMGRGGGSGGGCSNGGGGLADPRTSGHEPLLVP